MRWLDEPPCVALDVEHEAPGELRLRGPTTTDRVKGGALAAFGAGFAAFAVPFLRLPIPGPFKLVPLVLGAVGSGVAATGVATAAVQVRVDVTRARVRFDWKLGPVLEKSLEVPAADVAGVELRQEVQHHTSEYGFHDRTTVTWQLVLVTRAGRAVAMERFSLELQAKLRKEQVERALAAKKRAKPRRPNQAPHRP